MKKISRRSFLTATAVVAATGALSACGATASSTSASASTADETTSSSSTADATATQSFVIGISQLVQHGALDAATQGFQDKVLELAPEGTNVEFDLQNASGDTANCVSIASGFVAAGVDLIMANGTAALQAASAATGDIPILGTSITEYGVALGLENFTGTVGTNVSGCSDLAPLDEQAEMLATMFPDAKNVALLYCSAEPNSTYQVTAVRGFLEEKGMTCEEFSFADTNDLTPVTQAATEFADVIYVPTDNTVASNTEAINNVCLPAGIPIIAGEESICKGCGVATLSIDYYDLGLATGAMAARVLFDGEDISAMPIEYAADFTPKYNPTNCTELGITPPEGYVAIEME